MYRCVLVVYCMMYITLYDHQLLKMKLAPVHELLGDNAFVAFYTIRHFFSSEVVWFTCTVHVQQNYKSIYICTEVYILY